MANMIGAFLGRGMDGTCLFQNLQIMEDPECRAHLNQHNVLFIDFSKIPRDCTSYGQYIGRIQDGINRELAEIYQDVPIQTSDAVWDVLLNIFQKKREKFVFVIDEWDAVFHMPFISEDEQKEYLLFVEREDKAGEGYVDFIFYPERRSADAVILELKVDGTPEEAIKQIKEKNYALRFRRKLGENPKYTGKILAVGISYDRKTKKHFCKVETLL